MFSGKSTELLRRLRIEKVADKSVSLVKNSRDIRTSGAVTTHDGITEQAITVDELILLATTTDADVVGIDEGQFFEDIVEACDILVGRGKEVIVSALDGDYKMEPIGQIHKLIPRADEVNKLRAVCSVCKKSLASFSGRKVHSEAVFDVGGKDKYYASCRKCHTIV
jgi:thymidine kinase